MAGGAMAGGAPLAVRRASAVSAASGGRRTELVLELRRGTSDSVLLSCEKNMAGL